MLLLQRWQENNIRKEVRKISKKLEFTQKNGQTVGYIEVKAATDKERAKLNIYGDITDSELWSNEEVYPSKVSKLLASLDDKDLDIFINSAGGSFTGGIAIYNQLKNYIGKKRVYIEGLAGSAASIIALAGDEVYIYSNSFFMIHNAWIYISGNKNKLTEALRMLEKMDETMVDTYLANAKEGVTREEIIKMMDEETWLTGKECAEYFNVTCLEGIEAVAHCVNGLSEDTIPERVKTKLKARVEEPEKKKEPENTELAKAKLNLKLKTGGLI